MSRTFLFRVMTPLKTLDREIRYLRLGDRSGQFGIMARHTNLLSVVQPSLGYYTLASGDEVFFAVKEGVLRISEGQAILAARGFFENIEADELSADIEKTLLELSETETVVARMLEGLERMFIEKTRGFLR